jgi:hypothetical protein
LGLEKVSPPIVLLTKKSRLFYNTVISASEREAGYVIDGTMHNDEIESSIHSKDTLGHSDIVFGLCNTPGIFFAPGIKNYKDQFMIGRKYAGPFQGSGTGTLKNIGIDNYRQDGFREKHRQYKDQRYLKVHNGQR